MSELKKADCSSITLMIEGEHGTILVCGNEDSKTYKILLAMAEFINNFYITNIK